MINYLLALAIVSVVGVAVGTLLVRNELRRADRVYRAAREELERLATARPVTAEATASPTE